MKQILLIFIFIISSIMNKNLQSQSFYNDSSPLVSTYSIVARDSVTGEIGVAVQSHWFNVGADVGWGEAGVGVIATQSFVNVSFGIRGLDLLKQGKSPQEVVDELISSDSGRDFRQLAVLDVKGRSASYTGKSCVPEAGNIAEKNVSVQANLMLNNTVWPAMLKAFKKSKGPLAERMLSALEAGQKEKGDIRGMQSAAITVFRGESTSKNWEDKLMDLRVEDNPEPVKELKRLLQIYRAYEHMNNGDLATEKGDLDLALKEYSTAESMFPSNAEMKFWHAVMLANNKKVDESLPIFKDVFAMDNNWAVLTPRLRKVGLLNVSDSEMEKILSVK
jgi:uncharacterized Ntn-hydrolase superfamily protein